MIDIITIAIIVIVIGICIFFKSQQASNAARLVKIRDLTPELNNINWYILGQCTAAGDVRLTNRNFKVFSFELTDEHGGSIEIYAYGTDAESMFLQIQVGRGYTISQARMKIAANTVPNATGHSYTLEISSANLQPALVTPKIPSVKLNIVPLNTISQYVEKRIDVLAIITKVHTVYEYGNDNGHPLVVRKVQLMDTSRAVTCLVLFGRRAREFEEKSTGQVIGIKKAMVQFKKEHYNIMWPNRIELDPPLPEVALLYKWYRREILPNETGNLAGGSQANNAQSSSNASPRSRMEQRNGHSAGVENVGTKPLMSSTVNGGYRSKAAGAVSKTVPLSLGVIPLKQLHKFPDTEVEVDILAVIDEVKLVTEFASGDVKQRIVVLVDQTCTKVDLVLWNYKAQCFKGTKGDIIGIKGAKYSQGYVFLTDDTRIEINPKATTHLRGVGDLKEWYKYERNDAKIKSIARN